MYVFMYVCVCMYPKRERRTFMSLSLWSSLECDVYIFVICVSINVALEMHMERMCVHFRCMRGEEKSMCAFSVRNEHGEDACACMSNTCLCRSMHGAASLAIRISNFLLATEHTHVHVHNTNWYWSRNYSNWFCMRFNGCRPWNEFINEWSTDGTQ